LRPIVIRAFATLVGIGLIAGSVMVALPPAGLDAIHSRASGSLCFEDRNGVRLREVPIGASRARWVRLSELPPWVEPAFTTAEDHRFRQHPGVDAVAMLRALRGNHRVGRVASGASTMTMQVARLAANRSPGGGLSAKLREVLDAVRLEQRLDKDEILEQYLNRAPFGRGAIGIEAAAMAWFGHSARTLTPGETLLLSILPRAPERLSRTDAAPGLESRRVSLLAKLMACGPSRRHFQDAAEAPIVVARAAPPFEAPHLTTWLLASLPPEIRSRAGVIRTTLDGRLQTEIEQRLKPRLDRLAERGARQAAVVVFDNAKRELVVLLGSVDFFDPEAGQVNGATARRQPGSTLKPFTYALAFESGLTPASLVDDDSRAFPAAGGPFVPRNYGGQSFGHVRIREALASSLNIAAVDALAGVGADRFFEKLVALDLLENEQAVAEAGLGLTLGVAEVRLVDLANAYVTLARGGRHGRPSILLGVTDPLGRPLPLAPPRPEERLIHPVAAWWITDILTDGDARLRSFGRNGVLDMPWPVAVKTGTSSDWRDNWAVGYTREWTVAVWVGDFTGAPMHQVSGVFGAAPIVREIFGQLASKGELTAPPRPPGLTPYTRCVETGEAMGPGCPGSIVEWLPDGSAEASCDGHAVRATSVAVRGETGLATVKSNEESSVPEAETGGSAADRIEIQKPVPGDVFFLDPALPRGSQVLQLEAESEGSDPLIWWIDGFEAGVTHSPHRILWPLTPGPHQVTVGKGVRRKAVLFAVLCGPSDIRRARSAATDIVTVYK